MSFHLGLEIACAVPSENFLSAGSCFKLSILEDSRVGYWTVFCKAIKNQNTLLKQSSYSNNSQNIQVGRSIQFRSSSAYPVHSYRYIKYSLIIIFI